MPRLNLKFFAIGIFTLYSVIVGIRNYSLNGNRQITLPDSRAYIEGAKNITENFKPESSFRVLHLTYVIFLSGIVKVFGENIQAIYLIQTLLGITTGFLFLLLANRLIGSAGMVLLAVTLAVYPFHLYMNTYVLSETLAGFLVVLFLHTLFNSAAESDRFLSVKVICILTALSLVRPEGAAYVIGFIWIVRRMKWRLLKNVKKWKKIFISVSLVVIIGGVLFQQIHKIVPYDVARFLFSEAVPVEYVGQYTSFPVAPAMSRYKGNILYKQFKSIDHAPDNMSKKKLYLKYMVKYIKANPLGFIKKKIMHFENTWGWCGYCQRIFLDKQLIVFKGLVYLSFIGMIFSWLFKDKKFMVISLIFIVQNLIFIALPAVPRHRIPHMPVVFIFSVYAVIQIYKAVIPLLLKKNIKELRYKVKKNRTQLLVLMMILFAVHSVYWIVKTNAFDSVAKSPIEFYDEEWAVIKADDGIGERMEKRLYAQLSSPDWILKKELYLDDEPSNIKSVKIAYYNAYQPYKPKGGLLGFYVNGHNVFTGIMSRYGGIGYNEVSFNSKYLQKGENSIAIKKENIPGYIYVMIDSDTWENRSRRSNDGGRSWSKNVVRASDKTVELLIRLIVRK